MGGGGELSPSVLGTVLPQQSGLIGMQRGACPPSPRFLSMSLLLGLKQAF